MHTHSHSSSICMVEIDNFVDTSNITSTNCIFSLPKQQNTLQASKSRHFHIQNFLKIGLPQSV
ncbi:hypothetical protein Fmac_028852 [Flemingia macrophylla]|uniref:Uncharacterized protein n=1 Tax=Flemingia macrophylla TaxID=520843 RepID=A0ABD1L901_9FABA